MTIKEAFDKQLLIYNDICYVGNIIPNVIMWYGSDEYYFNNFITFETKNINEYFPFTRINRDTFGIYITVVFAEKNNSGSFSKVNYECVYESICQKILDFSELIKNSTVERYQNGDYKLKIELDENILVKFDNELELPVLYLPEHEYYSIE